ncbi:conserved hypothetical protein [Trichormus variabilis ATCC 29413]|uniref:Uncharacterized protein n=2 Tax=Anabaena variabilis TaxID=264691 RepID=Q3M8P5_TRIV2|nr:MULTISPECIES: hypothetical protein [Nostocaceae]ABA22641.1 conserved hypothetical protein [Trichormus variabilis ATCC 29413]MBC1215893.1 hypothetical protein [Trichormus variabilis ARAD]MBC1254133.1 hypothetical protein [Trichormus variabilis V5]MBC1267056.1 hypothetical protein [Trichormus variabilis FSR]MBC1303694.1 hypothetical protein [Trichormus variabilis N2B]
MTDLKEVLTFIEKIESENLGKSAYEIANLLRGYTKSEYTSKLWTLATGYEQKYIAGAFQGRLNKHLLLSGEMTDFAHFIASLSDQINQPGIKKSDLTSWTADHTSWAGDIGSAIIFYRSQADKGNAMTLERVLMGLASDSDFTANVAAYLVGFVINLNQQTTISQAIADYDEIQYAEHIKIFIKKRFGGIIEGNKLQNPDLIESEIQQSVSTFMKLYSPASNLYKSLKTLLKFPPQLRWQNKTVLNSSDLQIGSQHFLSHVMKYAALERQ